jgi:hypothetical protein
MVATLKPLVHTQNDGAATQADPASCQMLTRRTLGAMAKPVGRRIHDPEVGWMRCRRTKRSRNHPWPGGAMPNVLVANMRQDAGVADRRLRLCDSYFLSNAHGENCRHDPDCG